MVFLVFIGLLYPPPAWKVILFDARKVLQKIFFRWWLCTFFSSLLRASLRPGELGVAGACACVFLLGGPGQGEVKRERGVGPVEFINRTKGVRGEGRGQE